MKRIIYQTPGGGVAVIVPSQEALDLYGIDAIALKDVPPGVAFRIVDVADIPSDRTFRDAWEAVMTAPDGIGAESNSFPEAS